jgi:hypothetical protein
LVLRSMMSMRMMMDIILKMCDDHEVEMTFGTWHGYKFMIRFWGVDYMNFSLDYLDAFIEYLDRCGLTFRLEVSP